VLVELIALFEQFDGKKYCLSCANFPGYNIEEDSEGRNMLTRQKDKLSTIKELEVWAIKRTK
jgi:hypothetical protein